MPYGTTGLYPEDLHGNKPTNLITNELQTLQVPGPLDFYFIIPKAAPFFVDSLIVVNAATNTPYLPGVDYQVGNLFIEAMNSTGRPIAGSIRFMRNTIQGQAKLTYRTLGGVWGFDDAAILAELSNKTLNPLVRSWGDIAPLPYSFPPLPHDQRVDTLVGSEQINETLESIAAILDAASQGTSEAHLTNYNNPHRVTAAQVGLGNVPNYAMATLQQHLEAERVDLFTNPANVYSMLTTYAVQPLNQHIGDRLNPHRVTAAQVGLGNVPNYPIATNAQATDPTNTTTLMTPYTVAIAVQSLQKDPRLDQLIIDFNDHLTANNPHRITPAMIGAYTTDEIDIKLDMLVQESDAYMFAGQTAEQWEYKFPAATDMIQILEALQTPWIDGLEELQSLSTDKP